MTAVGDDPWWHEAECANEHEFVNLAQRIQRTYCEPCPVRNACLEDALRAETNDPALPGKGWPIRGGLTGEERRSLIDRTRTKRFSQKRIAS